MRREIFYILNFIWQYKLTKNEKLGIPVPGGQYEHLVRRGVNVSRLFTAQFVIATREDKFRFCAFLEKL